MFVQMTINLSNYLSEMLWQLSYIKTILIKIFEQLKVVVKYFLKMLLWAASKAKKIFWAKLQKTATG